MPTRVSIISEGEELDVLDLDFKTVKESPNEYKTENGLTVKVRHSPVRIFLVLDDDGNVQYTEDGEPRVIVRQSGSVSALEEEEFDGDGYD